MFLKTFKLIGNDRLPNAWKQDNKVHSFGTVNKTLPRIGRENQSFPAIYDKDRAKLTRKGKTYC